MQTDSSSYVLLGGAESLRARSFAIGCLGTIAVVAAAAGVLQSAAPVLPSSAAPELARSDRLAPLHPADRVHSLPGAPPLEHVHYAGHAMVNRSAGNSLFYWFVESERVRAGELPHEVPLVLWLNGGPGASSLTGLLIEGIGPLQLQTDGATLRPIETGWQALAHVMAWDQPVGTGFASTTHGGYVTDMEQMAAQLLEGMRVFYARHPQYRTSPVYVTGESFAGKYIPHFAYHVHAVNHAAAARGEEWPLLLAGLAVGNGVLRPLLQFSAIPQVAEALGYTDAAARAAAAAALGTCDARLREIAREIAAGGGAVAAPAAWKFAYDACEAVEAAIYGEAVPFVYDVREARDAFSEATRYMAAYLNRADVRAALHVGGARWVQADGGAPGNAVSDHLWREQIDDLPTAVLPTLFAHYKTLFYAGQYDGSMCNQLGVSRTIDAVAWPGAGAYANASACTWRVGGAPAGVLRAAGRFGWLVVLNSGHLVPMNQPAVALEMVRRLIEPRERGFEGMCS